MDVTQRRGVPRSVRRPIPVAVVAACVPVAPEWQQTSRDMAKPACQAGLIIEDADNKALATKKMSPTLDMT